MSDIFVSYARPDQFLAGELAYALGREGWTVWWDSDLLPGQAFPGTIALELRKARCVVVLWSSHSVESRWVRDEATVAVERGVLIPVVVDDVQPPLGLREIQSADLRDWDGSISHRGFAALVRALQRIAGPPRQSSAINVTRKICLVGASGVGKTSLVCRYVKSFFSERYLSTLGVKVDTKDVTIGDSRVRLLIWDIEGHDDLREPRSVYLNGMSGYFIVIDGTRPDTLQRALAIDDWVQHASQGATPHIALINKADLADQWAIDNQMLETLRSQGWDIRVVSAKNGTGVEEAFQDLAARLISRSWTFHATSPRDTEFFDAPEKEARLLQSALARNEFNFLAWAKLAGILAEKNEALAAKAATRAEQASPDTAQARFVLAEEFVRANRLVDATKQLERCIQLDPTAMPNSRLVLASLYLRLGSARRALEQYQLCLAGSPGPDVRAEAEGGLRDVTESLRRDRVHGT